MSAHPFIVALDLGQAFDYTALSIVQPTGDTLAVRHLERYRAVPYPQIVSDTAALLARPELSGAALVIDQTGAGRPVYDMFAAAGLDPIGVTITGGDRAHNEGSEWRVPKRDLIAALQVALQNETLKVAAGLEHAETFEREALAFRVKINIATGHDSYEAHRVGDHDDLVLSVAMAVWFAGLPVPDARVFTW